ncbi:hypothetical protein LCER1_G009315 [Lachnellula cervina]|uniref:Uncharacterized protein n=1 Tax=Lachnellula cervina TaxID=1316786 RepID=A0A7D8YJQ5_9HELO|nr:hypothetical protein LCER1_G009315 [Lachnellula cervina]
MLKQIIKELEIPSIETIVYTNSFSLYKCLIKLRTTKEKRLIIDIIGLREIRWINSKDNPIDAIIKINPNWMLEILINTNSLTIRIKR